MFQDPSELITTLLSVAVGEQRIRSPDIPDDDAYAGQHHPYAEVLQFIQQVPCYSEKALREWADESIADPWLIAAAAVHRFTIVTFETYVNINTGNPCGKAKIPNVAEKFQVRTTDLFHMIRELGIRL